MLNLIMNSTIERCTYLIFQFPKVPKNQTDTHSTRETYYYFSKVISCQIWEIKHRKWQRQHIGSISNVSQSNKVKVIYQSGVCPDIGDFGKTNFWCSTNPAEADGECCLRSLLINGFLTFQILFYVNIENRFFAEIVVKKIRM